MRIQQKLTNISHVSGSLLAMATFQMSEHLDTLIDTAKSVVNHPMVQRVPEYVGLTPNTLIVTVFVIVLFARLFRRNKSSISVDSEATAALVKLLQERKPSSMDEELRKSNGGIDSTVTQQIAELRFQIGSLSQTVTELRFALESFSNKRSAVEEALIDATTRIFDILGAEAHDLDDLPIIDTPVRDAIRGAIHSNPSPSRAHPFIEIPGSPPASRVKPQSPKAAAAWPAQPQAVAKPPSPNGAAAWAAPAQPSEKPPDRGRRPRYSTAWDRLAVVP